MRELKIFRSMPTILAMLRTSACRSARTAGSKAWNRITPMAITWKCTGAFTTRSATATFRMHFCTVPGEHDSDIQIALKTSASLIENNIIERTHIAIMLEWGAAGNVISYNYTNGRV